MEDIPADELANRLPEILRRVTHGESFTITDHGKATAALGPVEPENAVRARQDALEAILELQARVKPLGIPVRAAIEEGRA